MNIQCEWENHPQLGERMIIKSCGNQIGFVAIVVDEPVLTLHDTSDYPSLAFSEIEHIMDNWNNLSKSS